MALNKYLMTTAAAIRPGVPVRYDLKINGKWVTTGGFVEEAIKTGDDEITVTVTHYKTGVRHTNVLRASWKIQIHMVALVNMNHVGTLTLWPTPKDHQNMAARAAKRAEGFQIAVFNVAL